MRLSMAAAVGLHVLLFASAVFVWPWSGKPVQIANVTAVTLTPSAAAPPPPAMQAPETQTAAAPEPTPKPAPPVPPKLAPSPPVPSPPKAAAPKPQPAPAPPKPAPVPDKIDPHAIPKPSQAKPQAKTKADDNDFLSSLTSSLDKTTSATAQAKPQATTKGPPRAETAPVARTDPGAEQATTDAAAAVAGRIKRLWNPSCGVEGFRDLVIPVQFHLTPDGALSGVPTVLGPPQPGNPVWRAAADRAVRAVIAAQPFSGLPRQTYSEWKTFNLNFQGKEACQNQ